MPKYKVDVGRSGYSRGRAVFILDARDESQAKELYYEGKCIEYITVRDDREDSDPIVELISEEEYNRSVAALTEKTDLLQEIYEWLTSKQWYTRNYLEGIYEQDLNEFSARINHIINK